MTTPCPRDHPPAYDLLGVGFGPSNLALAIALEEHNAAAGARRLSALFAEKQQRFGWHRGMLIDGATMQVSFLKDLVTMRDPTSDFSFLSYLHHRERLVDFINHKILFPTRVEFHDYLEWAAGRLEHLVEYGTEVLDVHPVTRGGQVTELDVAVRQGGARGDHTVRRARNIVLAAGLRPSIPTGVKLSDRVWHNQELLARLEGLAAPPRRCTVVGAGQSAAEAVEYLHRRFPEAEVCSVFTKYGYTPADDSPFANRIFDPEAVELFFGASRQVKRQLFDHHRNTNYSVVDLELIDELYRRAYAERVAGRQRLRLLNACSVRDLREVPGGVRATIEFLPAGQRTVIDSDVVVYATGYEPFDPIAQLGEMGKYCLRDDEGLVRVDRDYRLVTTSEVRAGIYLQGATEHTHGITSSLLSNTAVRAGEILHSLLD